MAITPDYILDAVQPVASNRSSRLGVQFLDLPQTADGYTVLASALSSAGIIPSMVPLNFQTIFENLKSDSADNQRFVANQIINNINPLTNAALNLPTSAFVNSTIPRIFNNTITPDYDPGKNASSNAKFAQNAALYSSVGLQLVLAYLTGGPASLIQQSLVLFPSPNRTPAY